MSPHQRKTEPGPGGGSLWSDWLSRTQAPLGPASGEPGGAGRCGARAPRRHGPGPLRKRPKAPRPLRLRSPWRPRCPGWCRSGRSTRRGSSPPPGSRSARGCPAKWRRCISRTAPWSARATSCSPSTSARSRSPWRAPGPRSGARRRGCSSPSSSCSAPRRWCGSASRRRPSWTPAGAPCARRRPASPPPAPRCAKRSSTWSSPRSAPRARAASATAGWTRATSSSRARR